MPDRKLWKRRPLIFAACVLLLSFSRLWAANATLTITGSVKQSGGGWDSGNITVAFNGYTETVHYAQFSTPASLASALAATFSRDYISVGLCANASGATITFHLKGSAAFTPINIQGPTTSFQLTPTGWPAQGSTVYDSGYVSLVVRNVGVSASYGQSSTPSTIAAELASAYTERGHVTNEYVTVTANGPSLEIQALGNGPAGDYSYLTSVQYDSQDFSSPSFSVVPASGSLGGGTGENGPAYSYSINYLNNSNVNSYTDSVMGTWSFTYDNLNRLATANAAEPSAASMYYCWSYDSFGNRTSSANSTSSFPAGYGGQSTNGCGSQAYTTTPNSQNQYASQLTYDAAGEVTNDGKNQYLYDAEGRICAVKYTPITNLNDLTVMIGYIYNADGARVAKGSITQWSCDPSSNGFTVQSDYVIGPAGEQSSEVAMQPNGTMVWQHTNVYANGQLMATYDNDGLHFHLSDSLGTRRVQTNADGVVEATYVTMPYGEMPESQPLGATEQHFTGKERDSESGLDYFGARYYASSMGRFMSPDWASNPQAVPYATYTNPQSLNLYNYMRNNPLSGTDPDGHCCWDWLRNTASQAGTGALKYLANQGTSAALGAGPAIGEASGVRNIAGTPTATFQTPSNTAQAVGYYATPIVSAVISISVTASAPAALETESGTVGTMLTSEGDTFTHYGFMADQANFAGGLREGAYATPASDLTGNQAQSTLALPNRPQGVPDAAYPVSPQPGTPITPPSTVQPANGYPGGGTEVTFPRGTGPGTVGPPKQISPQ